jgi:hypothetical protein
VKTRKGGGGTQKIGRLLGETLKKDTKRNLKFPNLKNAPMWQMFSSKMAYKKEGGKTKRKT